ncbi:MULTISPECIES: hypothetical protein [unclassified Exiguobacterium]|nr:MULTISPECIES: hypothetical protein [unclassified Exiguobacterium]
MTFLGNIVTESRACSFAVAARKIAALKTRRDKEARTDCLSL